MKVARILLENFKRFERLEIKVQNGLTEDVSNQFLLLGDNGTGKTTVLQAVALCLSMAMGRTKSVESFNWLGWIPGRYQRWGEPLVELEVHFDDEELRVTREVADAWANYAHPPDYVAPGNSRQVTLALRGGMARAPSAQELLQFRGRRYATQLLRTDPSARDLFAKLPGVFWFDQFRNLASPPAETSENDEDSGGHVSFNVGVARLREHLNRWQLERLAGNQKKHDFLLELENAYKRVFPGRSFGTPEPMYRGGTPTPEDYYFILSDGHRTYDIEEMSAGEQAVFPLLYEFVRQQVRKSVVLIDEIDLNLHPPLAQALLRALPTLGLDCQFLITTHSESISNLVSPEETYRLAGGRLCL